MTLYRTNRGAGLRYHQAREAEHRARRRLSLVAAIEREIETLGRGPARRVDVAGGTELRDRDGALVATVTTEADARGWWREPVVEARRPTGERWWPGEYLRRAG